MSEEIVTYGTAKFYIPEGLYTIAEIEELLAECKQTKALQDKAMQIAMEVKK